MARHCGHNTQIFFEIDEVNKGNDGGKKDNITTDILEIELIKKEIELLKTKYDTKIEMLKTLIDNLDLKIDLIKKGVNLYR